MRTKAIIIKKQNTNEYDQFVVCYTQEFGKLTAIAKSVLKPTSVQAMHLDTFNLVEFELIQGRSLSIITGAQADNSYRELKNSIPSLAIAHFFSEIIDKMVPELEKDERLWDFMVDLLDKLNRFEPSLTFLRQKQFVLLGLLGYSPEVAVSVSFDLSHLGPTSLDDTFEYNAGFRLKSLKFLHSVLR